MTRLFFSIVFIVCMGLAGLVSACDYCIAHPGEKELHYQGWYQISISRDDFSKLYYWYLYNFNIKDAYVYLEKLRGGEVINIGGITIASTKFNKNIIYPKPKYLIPHCVIQLLPIFRLPEINGWSETIFVGCIPAYNYSMYVDNRLRELNEKGYTEIKFNTKTKPFIKIKIEK